MANSVAKQTQQARFTYQAVTAAGKLKTRAGAHTGVELRVFNVVYAVACEAVSIAVHVAISR